jgi:hypothetical protein
MFNLLSKFFYPYIQFLMGAAYSIQQTLEGLGIATSNFLVRDSSGKIINSYWSVFEAVLPTLGILLIYSFLLCCAFCVAGYCLGRIKGTAIALLVLLSPGLFSTIDLWPAINFTPERFNIGGLGSLGSSVGMTSLVCLGLLSGWTLIVVATDFFRLQDRFRHFYDHIWYSMAILAGVFYVADVGTTQEQRSLQDASRQAQQASSYLLNQVRNYDAICRSSAKTDTASCIWASDIQQTLADYSVYDERLFWQLGPKTSADMYLPFRSGGDDLVKQIRTELFRFNDSQCPKLPNQLGQSSGLCQRPSAVFCTAIDKLDGIDESIVLRSVAIANECIIPTLVRLKESTEKNVLKVKAADQKKHSRWLFFIFAAMLAGGKVANATARLSKSRQGKNSLGLGDNDRINILASYLWSRICILARWFFKSIVWLFECIQFIFQFTLKWLMACYRWMIQRVKRIQAQTDSTR